MINDYLEVRNAEGMPKMVDETMSLAFLLNAKNGVRHYAIALTEAATPEVRAALNAQLNDAINLHEELTNLMIRKGWFHPVDLEKQFQMDMESSRNAVQIASLNLFPEDTSRLGDFATPYK
ncbi:spore coat protein [Clostridium folliculivorans]|uniref:Spore coat protein F-like protein YraD n=1 Tax=Clostridium folliculivorans TaxID=2886038 RepID=A0A9W5Y191_9CLOT|nr:spore coat protein [Clostridium folliculivorans]GKU24622.1 spore coat protein F-like protein YraD [Clostridium folliculivorans]GKU30720.1 spore coat protein F-like protein YraD [Clostridium folliculivorans]